MTSSDLRGDQVVRLTSNAPIVAVQRGEPQEFIAGTEPPTFSRLWLLVRQLAGTSLDVKPPDRSSIVPNR